MFQGVGARENSTEGILKNILTGSLATGRKAINFLKKFIPHWQILLSRWRY